MKQVTQLFNEWYDSKDAVPLSQYNRGAPVMHDHDEADKRDNANEDGKYDYYDLHDHYNDVRGKRSSKDRDTVNNHIVDSAQANHVLLSLNKKGLTTSPEHIKQVWGDVQHHVGIHNTPEKMSQHLQDLHRITHEHALPENHSFNIYTGVGAHHDIKGLREKHGDMIHFPAHTSTSLSPDTAHSFAKRQSIDTYGNAHHKNMPEMIRIGVHSKNTPHIGDHVGDVDSSEHEMLLRRGAVMKFHGEPKVFMHNGREVMIHDATLHGFHHDND